MTWNYPPQSELLLKRKDDTANDLGEVVRRNFEMDKAELAAVRRRVEMAARSGSLFNSMQVTWGDA